MTIEPDDLQQLPRTTLRHPIAKEDWVMGVLRVEAAACRDPNGAAAAKIVDNKLQPIAFGVSTMLNADSYTQSKKLDWDADRRFGFQTPIEVAIKCAIRRHFRDSYDGPLGQCTCYCTYVPTLVCIRECIKYGIKTILYLDFALPGFDEMQLRDCLKLADVNNITMKKFEGNTGWVRDWVSMLR